MAHIRPKKPVLAFKNSPAYGASTVSDLNGVTKYLQVDAINPSTTLATALIYGIKIDTRNFERRCMLDDVKAFHYVFGKVNHNIICKVEISGSAPMTINNRMELTAVGEALRSL